MDAFQRIAGPRFIPARAGNGPRGTGGGCGRSVHPRACGERSRYCAATSRPAGSSPRVRGTVPTRGLLRRVRRFIPARAGNGPATPPAFQSPAVHPRACGERYDMRLFFAITNGSSPRVRGTGRDRRPARRRGRFIPARAGNGKNCSSTACGTPVHPRACGERCLARRATARWGGSSPRVRGTAYLGVGVGGG